MSDDPNFGQFGEGVKPILGKRRSRLKATIILFLIAACIPSAMFGWNKVYVRFLENQLPTISIPHPPEGIGLNEASFTIEVGDASAGLDEVIIRAEQSGKQTTLEKKRYTDGVTYSDSIRITLDGKKLGFREGDLRLIIMVFDRSFWSNRKHANLYMMVDYSSPKIEVITTQHNAVLGGAELVFYNVYDDEKNFSGLSGIKVGSWLFPGFQAKDLDPAFENRPNVYFTFFPVPLELDRINHSYRLFVRDRVGNVSNASLYYRVRDQRLDKRRIGLDPDFLQTKVPALYLEYLKIIGREKEFKEAEGLSELIERYRIVNEEYRAIIEKSLSALFNAPRKVRYWEGKFDRPGNSRQVGEFAELREYEFEGINAGSNVNYGVDLVLSKGWEVVRAANEGVVIFSDELGVYGKTVILDHGFGLTTMYAHLSKLKTEEGAQLKRGDELGTAGQSGLADRTLLHYQVRLHGIPVRPVEWWDGRWLDDHIENKINSVKRLLGLRVGRVLD